MLYKYSDYLTNTNIIPTEEAQSLYDELVEIVKANVKDTTLMELWDELLEAVMDYAEFRQRWLLMEIEKRISKDKTRTMYHDVVMVKFDILARYMEKNGMDVSWKTALGENRKRVGDFACYIALFMALEQR